MCVSPSQDAKQSGAATVTDATHPALIDHAVLRIAAWPIETVDDFAAADLARRADQLAAAAADVDQRRERFVARIHAAVPGAPGRAARAWMLAVKRHAFGSLLPLPERPADVNTIDPFVLDAIRAEDAARRALAERTEAFDAAYAAEMERQRAALRQHAGTARFQKALLLSNPEVARRWQAADGRGLPPARARRLESTVFHYLMRAMGRPTPNGAWAGVAPVTPAAEPQPDAPLRVRAGRTHAVASVNLLPVQIIGRALAGQARYRRRGALRLTRTLVATEAGWRYERVVGSDGRWETLPAHPFSTALVRYFADGTARPVAPLLDMLAPPDSDLRAKLDNAIDVLIERGLLLCGPEVPNGAADCWEALAAFTAELLEPERSRWATAVGRIRAACGRLGPAYETLSPADVDAVCGEVAGELTALWTEAGLPGGPPGPALFLDMRAPFVATWDGDAMARATTAVREMFAFYAADGGAELFRRQMLRGYRHTAGVTKGTELLALLAGALATEAEPARAADDGAPVPWLDTRETVFEQFYDDPEVRLAAGVQQERLDALLEPAREAQVFVLTVPDDPWPEGVYPGPAGAVLLTPGRDGTVWLGLARPQPGLFVTRFAGVLGEDAEPLLAGLRERAEEARRAGVQLVEVLPGDSPNPNAALRPAVTPERLTTRGVGDIPLDGLLLVLDERAMRPWLRVGEDGALIAPVYNSGAAPGVSDRCGVALLGLTMGHGWEFPSFGFPASRIERRERHLARLLLPGGAVLSPERWTLDQATLDRLRGCRDAARYRVWRSVAVELGLPALVRVQWGPDQTELLLRTDSPLAVRCLFDTLALEIAVLTLVELPGDREAWPVHDGAGLHYLAEVGVIWYADGYWAAAAPEVRDAP